MKVGNLQRLLEKSRAAAPMQLEEIPVYQVGSPWKVYLDEQALRDMLIQNLGDNPYLEGVLQALVDNNGFVQSLHRTDGGFFGITGVRMWGANREVRQWDQLGVVEYGTKHVVVLVTNYENTQFLVSVAAEPFNPTENGESRILVRAPLQSSQGNILGLHGAKPPARAGLYNHPNTEVREQVQDGGRLAQAEEPGQSIGPKVVELGLLQVVDFNEFMPLLPGEIIVGREELLRAMEDGDCNAYLVQVLSRFHCC